MLKKFIQSLLITSVVCLSSCVSTVVSPSKNETVVKTNEEQEKKFNYISLLPEKVFIDDSNNGIAIYPDYILKIKNLELTDEKIPLVEKIQKVNYVSYSVDKDGDGILIYEVTYSPFYNERPSSDAFYMMKIEKNNFLKDTNKEIFVGNSDYLEHITQIDKNSFYFFYQEELLIDPDNPKESKLVLNTIKNYELKTYKFDKGYSNQLKSKIDNNGNGYYYYENNLDARIYLKEYKVVEKIIPKEESVGYIINDYLDNTGTGIIIYKKIGLYYQKVSNFKKIGNEEVLYDGNEVISDYKNGIFTFPVFINKSGNGVIFFSRRKIKEDDKSYIYTKKVEKFKVDKKETKLSETKKLLYANVKVNKNGNGLLLLLDLEGYILLQKVLNYEIEI